VTTNAEYSTYDDDELHHLARALELNPSVMERWRSFVYALGPLGVSTVPGIVSCCTTATTTNSSNNCQECCRLLHGIHVDRQTLSILSIGGTNVYFSQRIRFILQIRPRHMRTQLC
jgi:hypothetical protein